MKRCSTLLQSAVEYKNKLSREQELALIELTWQIQNQCVYDEDVATILASKDDKNQYLQYLLACLYSFGAKNPFVEKNYEESLKILKPLVNEHASTYAMNLYYYHVADNKIEKGLQKDGKKLLLKAANLGNPLAVLNFFAGTINKISELDQRIYENENIMYYLKQYLIKQIPYLVIAHAKLKYTHYIDELNKITMGLLLTLTQLTDYLVKQDDKENNEKIVADAWLQFAAYYKCIDNDFLKFYTLQQASRLKSQYEAMWLAELGGDNMPFNTIRAYLNSFLDALAVIQKKTLQITSREELLDIALMTDITFKNCHFLYTYHSPVYAKNEKIYHEFSVIFQACEKRHTDLQTELQEKATII